MQCENIGTVFFLFQAELNDFLPANSDRLSSPIAAVVANTQTPE